MADPETPFVWGSGGEQLSPGQLASRRRIAEAMMAQGMDASPIRSPWQGLDRVAKAMFGAYESRQADDQEASARQAAVAQLMAALGGGAPAAAASAPAGVSASPVGAAPVTADASEKVYRADEPSPLDPPSGADRDRAIRTVVAEAGNQGPAGMQAVASVIRNRAVDGGYGGNTPSAVVTAPRQFEPWGTEAGRTKMAAIDPNSPSYKAAGAAVDRAYFGDDPTEGKTLFYSPKAQAALGRPAPSWARGDGQAIGDHVFFDDNGGLPAKAMPAQGQGGPPGVPVVSPGVAAVARAMPSGTAPAMRPGIGPVMTAMTNPFLPPSMAHLAVSQLNRSTYGDPYRDTDGNLVQRGSDGKISVLSAAEKPPSSVAEFEYGQKNPKFAEYQLAKTKAGAAQLNNQNNIDLNSSQTYDKQLAEGLGKSHASLANGVEDAQSRARDVAAMQGAIDAIQKNGGTTGGLAPEKALTLQKAINSGAAAVGIDKPFSEQDLSDREFLTKFNRQMAGAQAKNAVGSRVTNFEMSNYLKANPGLDMTITGNQRLLGIQAQIEQRNIAVGNAIREATAVAIARGKKIDPVTVQKIITDYDEANHIRDPITGQDLTQSYVLPEFQKLGQGTNAALAKQHDANVGKIRRYNPATGALE